MCVLVLAYDEPIKASGHSIFLLELLFISRMFAWDRTCVLLWWVKKTKQEKIILEEYLESFLEWFWLRNYCCLCDFHLTEEAVMEEKSWQHVLTLLLRIHDSAVGEL